MKSAPIARPGRRAPRSNAGREKMAVRRQLQELFQDPQFGGAITVERPPSPAAPARALRSLSPSPPSSPPTSGATPPPRLQGPLPEDCAVFQCCGCWAVLGDSLHLCAQEDRRLGLLVCFSQCRPGRAPRRGIRAGLPIGRPARSRSQRVSLSPQKSRTTSPGRIR